MNVSISIHSGLYYTSSSYSDPYCKPIYSREHRGEMMKVDITKEVPARSKFIPLTKSSPKVIDLKPEYKSGYKKR